MKFVRTGHLLEDDTLCIGLQTHRAFLRRWGGSEVAFCHCEICEFFFGSVGCGVGRFAWIHCVFKQVRKNISFGNAPHDVIHGDWLVHVVRLMGVMRLLW